MIRIVVFTVFLLFVFPAVVFAKDATGSSAPKQQEAPYALPYPGLLPDSPFYGLKMLRDKIVDFLISDPRKKIEFNLLSADKRLSVGVTLFSQKNPPEDLAVSTISKGEDYFQQAIFWTREAKAQGIAVVELDHKLISAAKAHEIILGKLIKGAKSKKAKTALKAIQNRVAKFRTELAAIQ